MILKFCNFFVINKSSQHRHREAKVMFYAGIEVSGWSRSRRHGCLRRERDQRQQEQHRCEAERIESSEVPVDRGSGCLWNRSSMNAPIQDWKASAKRDRERTAEGRKSNTAELWGRFHFRVSASVAEMNAAEQSNLQTWER